MQVKFTGCKWFGRDESSHTEALGAWPGPSCWGVGSLKPKSWADCTAHVILIFGKRFVSDLRLSSSAGLERGGPSPGLRHLSGRWSDLSSLGPWPFRGQILSGVGAGEASLSVGFVSSLRRPRAELCLANGSVHLRTCTVSSCCQPNFFSFSWLFCINFK